MADEHSDVFILNEELLLKIMGENVGNIPEPILLDGQRRVVVRDILFGIDVNGVERPIFIETDRSAAVSLHGEDPSNDIVGLRTDEQRLLRNRPYEPFRAQANVGLGAAWGTMFTCPADSIAKVWVHFGQTSGGTTDYTAALRVRNCVIGIGFPVYIDAPSPSFGPYILAAADVIQAYRVTGVNGAVICDYELYSTGDTNTGV